MFYKAFSAVLGVLTAIVLFALVLFSCVAQARTQVYLESERDLGNGFKLCIYSEGVTITRPAHQLCPLTIEV